MDGPQEPYLGATYERLRYGGFPQTIRDWIEQQAHLFEGYPPLPPGWIRVWSRTHNLPSYLYVPDGLRTATTDLYEVLRHPATPR